MPIPAPSPLARHWSLDPNVVFLNHGSFGACPNDVLAKQTEFRALLEREPVRFVVEEQERLLDSARRELGAFLNADAAGLAFVANATTGVNAVVRSLEFEPGDELLTGTHEYNACSNVLRYVADRSGAVVVSAPVPFPVSSPEEIERAVLAAVTSRTKLVLLSHVTSPTGLVFPVEGIVAELNRRGVDCLVDGAHAPGMTPLDLTALNAPYYAGNCHKWLCAPKGAAFIHVREDRRRQIHPTTISHGYNSVRTDRERFRLEFDYVGSMDVSPWLCVPEAIRFMASLDPDGWPGVMRANRTMALEGRRILCGSLGVEIAPAPEEMLGSLATVPLPPRTPAMAARPTKYHDALHDALLARHGIQVPVVVWPSGSNTRWVRIALQRYNTLDQVRFLGDALAEELRIERSNG